jgi:AcrR family transcriptional regulator
MSLKTRAAKAPQDLRRAMLDASLALIRDEGLERLSMREVARRAGVSHQAPYHHFADKEAILAALVAEGFELLRQASLKATEGVKDPSARLTALGQAYVQFALSHPAHFKLMFRSELVREHEHEEARACAEGAYEVLVSAAGDVARERGLPVELVTLAGWSLVHGLSTLMLEGKLDKMFEKPAARAKAAKECIAMFEAFWSGKRTSKS